MSDGHVCVEREAFEVMLVAYPHAVWRCRVCSSVTRMVAVDDLEPGDFEYTLDMIKRYRRAHGNT